MLRLTQGVAQGTRLQEIWPRQKDAVEDIAKNHANKLPRVAGVGGLVRFVVVLQGARGIGGACAGDQRQQEEHRARAAGHGWLLALQAVQLRITSRL
jgi:hypothetical protein